MGEAFGIVHQSIFESSLSWDWEARIVFQDMIILADEHDDVMMTTRSLAYRTRAPLELVMRAVKSLSEPDPDSRSKEEDGRRITLYLNHEKNVIGFHVVNRGRYKHMLAESRRRSYQKQWVKNKRAAASARAKFEEGRTEDLKMIENINRKGV